MAAVIRLLDVLLNLFDEEVSAQSRASATGAFFQLFDCDAHRVERPKINPKLLEVPLFWEALCGRRDDVPGDRLIEERADLIFKALAVEHSMALVVDDQPLPVHDLVILQHVLANLKVLALDLPLCASDCPRHHLRLDRHIVRNVEPTEERLYHRGIEAAHEFVFQRQVEASLTRVTLTARATTQLVVDPARFVAFGTEDVQATKLGDLLVFGSDRCLCPLQRFRPSRLVFLWRLNWREALLFQLGSGTEFGVSTEHDVGTTTGHVGRNHDCALTASLGNDLGLTIVELGVQHFVFHAGLSQSL